MTEYIIREGGSLWVKKLMKRFARSMTETGKLPIQGSNGCNHPSLMSLPFIKTIPATRSL